MIPNHRCVITGGGSKADGEIRIWQNLELNKEGHCLYRDQKAKSVYAIAISPSGKYLAAGSKIGLVRIWPYLDFELKENSPFNFEIYHQLCQVTALVFLTDDLLLSAGINGKIRVISITQEKSLKDIEAHSGPICSLIALGSRVIASLGTDGDLKIWDMDSLSCVFRKEGLLFPADSFSLFPSLVFSEDRGHLYCPSSDGELHIFDLRNACSHKQIRAHRDAYYAMTICGKYLLTGGAHDQRLKLWDSDTNKPDGEIEVGASVLRLCSIGESKAIAICHESDGSQSLRLFQIPKLQPSEIIQGLDLRSIATTPPSTFLHRENVALNQLKNNLIDHARSKLDDPEGMAPILNQLVERGFWAEAKLLQADSARARNKPLYELGFLLQLTENIKVSRGTVPVFYRLARLLEQLNEPDLATKVFEKVKTFFKRVEDVIQRLKAHPLNNLDRTKTIRLDISTLELAIQEMEKDTVLGRLFRWRLLIPSDEHREFVIQSLHDLDLWKKSLQEQTSSKGRNIKMGLENVLFFDGQNIRESSWLNISQIGIRCPSPYLDYAIEINQENGLVQGYGIFNPNKKVNSVDDVVTHNATLSQIYQSIYKRRKIGNWLNKVHDRLRELDRDSSFIRS